MENLNRRIELQEELVQARRLLSHVSPGHQNVAMFRSYLQCLEDQIDALKAQTPN